MTQLGLFAKPRASARLKPVAMAGLRRRRIAAGLSLEDMAAAILATKAHLSKIELGQSALDVVSARVLASKLNCTIEDLF